MTTKRDDKDSRSFLLPPWLWVIIASVAGVILAILVIALMTSPAWLLLWSAQRSEGRATRVAATGTAQAIAEATAEVVAAETGTAEAVAQETSTAETGTAQASAEQTGVAQTSTAEVVANQTGTAQAIAQATGAAQTATAQAIAVATGAIQTATAEAIAAETGTAQASADATATAEAIAQQTEAEQTSIAQTATAEASAAETATAQASIAQTATAEAEESGTDQDDGVAQTATAQANLNATRIAQNTGTPLAEAIQTATAEADAAQTRIAQSDGVAQTATAQANLNGTRIAQSTGTPLAEAIETATAEADAAQTRIAQSGGSDGAAQTATAQANIDGTRTARISTVQAQATQSVRQTRVVQIRETYIASAQTRTAVSGGGPTVTVTPNAIFTLVQGQDYIVQADDWLSKLSDKFYGSPVTYWPIIAATNQISAQDPTYDRIDDPDFIEIGDKLLIPSVEIAEGFMADFVVGSGIPETIVDEEGVLRVDSIIIPTVTPAPSPPPGVLPPPLPPTATPEPQGLVVPAVPADATPIPPPSGALTLVSPISLNQPTFGPTTFVWEWNGESLPPTYSFEVRVWFPGAAPTGVHDAVADSQTGRISQVGPNRYQLRIGNIRAAQGVQGEAGIYQWTVNLVRVAPDYADTGIQADPTRLRIEASGP